MSLQSSSASSPVCGLFSTCDRGGMRLPQEMEVYSRPNGNLEIKPIEGGGLGYGIGRAIRMGFDFFCPKMTGVFQWVVKNLPQPSLLNIRGASAAVIPPSAGTPKKLMRQFELTQGCQKARMGNCSIPQFGKVSASGELVGLATDKFGIQFIRVSDPWKPYVIGFFNNIEWSPMDLVLSEDRAFVAFDAGGLLVLSLKNPKFPEVIGFYNNTKWKNVGAKQIALSGNRAYLGLGSSRDLSRDAGFLGVFDIQKPTPIMIGNYTFTDWWWGPFAIANNLAFLPSWPGHKVTVLDISQPKPIDLTTFNVNMTSTKVAAQGNYLYLGGNNGGIKFQIVDMTNAKKPDFRGSILFDSYERDIFEIDVLGKYAFITMRDWTVDDSIGSAVYIIDISNPDKPIQVDEYSFPKESVVYTAILGNKLYSAGRISEGRDNFFEVGQIDCP